MTLFIIFCDLQALEDSRIRTTENALQKITWSVGGPISLGPRAIARAVRTLRRHCPEQFSFLGYSHLVENAEYDMKRFIELWNSFKRSED